MNPSEIGFIVMVLLEKSWGKTSVGGRPRSQSWWKDRLKSLIEDETEYTLPEGYSWNPNNVDWPIPYEVEYNLSNASDCVNWLREHNA